MVIPYSLRKGGKHAGAPSQISLLSHFEKRNPLNHRLRKKTRCVATKNQEARSGRNGWQPIREAIRGDHADVAPFLFTCEQIDALATVRTGDAPMSLSRKFCCEDDRHPITQLMLQAMEEQR